MLPIINNIKRPLRWIRRFRKRRGYGIHSPFAFQWVTGVVYERGVYYAYKELAEQFKAAQHHVRLKDLQLLFRITNAHNPKATLAIGQGNDFEQTCRYMNAAHRMAFHAYTSLKDYEAHETTSTFEMVYIEEHLEPEHLAVLQSLAHDRLLIIVRQPRRNATTKQTWQQLCKHTWVRQSFDLHDYGVCFCEERLNKEHFIINYY